MSLNDLQKTLLPPLRFAAKDDGARADRLRGFSTLARGALDGQGALPDALRAVLEEAANRFDETRGAERVALIHKLQAALSEAEPDVAPAPRSATPPQGREPPRAVTPSTTAAPARSSDGPPPDHPAAQGAEPSASTHTGDDSSFLEIPNNAAAKPVRRRRVRPTATSDTLSRSVSTLRGVGEKKAQALEARGFVTLGDLLMVLPRTYEDRRNVVPIASLEPGRSSVVRGRVIARGQIGRGRGARFEVSVADSSGTIKLTFFRFRPWEMTRRYQQGDVVTAVGTVEVYRGTRQMVHPTVQQGDRVAELSGIAPLYPEIKGLHPLELQRTIGAAMTVLDREGAPELLPSTVLTQAHVIPYVDALIDAHQPAGDLDEDEFLALCERRAPCHRRLAFEELFVLQLAMLLKRQEHTVVPALPVARLDGAKLFGDLFPFSPTGAQARCVNEILDDMAEPVPMGRLLQGDVGAGKTAVAAAAALSVIKQKGQAAVMAPTELLAEQHYRTFRQVLTPLGYKVAFFSGSLRGKARTLKIAELKNRMIDVAVGTHALLTEDVAFAKLQLAVIDEQHRFGVAQRLALKEKGPPLDDGIAAPHVLVMSATPIPRSLALTVYGDLTLSALDELPPGRSPVETQVKTERGMEGIFKRIAAAVKKGERVYVVYPLIEESEKLDLKDATQGAQTFAERFGDEHVGLVHGRMSADDKEAVMRRFSSGEISILVSTTVIEVGVDVSAATFMVIMNAERFGLSQLHQLRGRVGRSDKQSHCVLVVGKSGASKNAVARLRIMEKTHDGFRIAEEDLKIRGPGDFMGTRQSGLPSLAFADLTRHAELLALARDLATTLIDDDPQLAAAEHLGLKTLVYDRFAGRIGLTGAG